MAAFAVGHVIRTNPPLARPSAMARALVRAPGITTSAADVCEAAQMLAHRFGYESNHLDDLACVYESWDGTGFPGRASGEVITLPARIVYVASVAVAAHHEGGSGAAAALVAEAAGHRLDPTVSKAFLDDPEGMFDAIDRDTSLWDATIASDPQPATMIDAAAIDESLRAVADFVDLKSPWLGGRSSGVASLTATAAQSVGLRTEQVRAVRRAGWLHDVGRIGVSAGIWAREGRLTPHEWEQVRLHPYYTERVLSRAPMLNRLASIASAHHERLDGSGYHRAAKAAELSVTARILATADAFHTKLEARPHRAALTAEEAAKDLREAASAGRLDGDAVEAVLAASGQPARRRASGMIAGLTPREIETLRLVARGLTIRQIAPTITIAPKTADGNIQRVYAKIGTSTRAGATLFALQHDLLKPPLASPKDREFSP